MLSLQIQSDRSALGALLGAPLVIAAAAFVVAVAVFASGPPPAGSTQSNVAGLAFVYLTLGLMWLPSYSVGYGWFWWATRRHADDENKLLGRLYLMPLVCSLFVWFPSLVFSPGHLGEKVRLLPVFALTAVLGGYIWIGMVRGIFYLWRQR